MEVWIYMILTPVYHSMQHAVIIEEKNRNCQTANLVQKIELSWYSWPCHGWDPNPREPAWRHRVLWDPKPTARCQRADQHETCRPEKMGRDGFAADVFKYPQRWERRVMKVWSQERVQSIVYHQILTNNHWHGPICHLVSHGHSFAGILKSRSLQMFPTGSTSCSHSHFH